MNTNKQEEAESEKQTQQNYFIEEIGSQPDLDFSNDNVVHLKQTKKRNIEYSSTKVKARNILTNISYRRFKQTDFMNVNFIIDLLTYTLQFFCPVDIGRKLNNEDEQKMVKFIWERCVPLDFSAEVYKPENFLILSNPKITFNKANKIVKKWIKERENIGEVCELIKSNFKYLHYVFSSLFPKVYSRINQFGIQNKNDFDLIFQTYKIKGETNNYLQKIFLKTAENYKREVHIEEQKPIEITEEIKLEPKLPTQKRKREKVIYDPEQYKKQKKDLEDRLERSTQQLNAIKNRRKMYKQTFINSKL